MNDNVETHFEVCRQLRYWFGHSEIRSYLPADAAARFFQVDVYGDADAAISLRATWNSAIEWAVVLGTSRRSDSPEI